jgi:hypothetical protein
MACEGCGKICRGLQGIRGHQRSCPGRKKDYSMSEQPGSNVVEPQEESGRIEVDRGAEQVILMGSRLDQQAAEKTMELHQETDAQLYNVLEQLDVRRLMDGVARERKWPTYDDWYELGNDVYRLKLSLETIVTQARVSRDEPWALYKLALTIRERWVRWRREEAERCWQKQIGESQQDFEDVLRDFGVPDLEVAWSRIIEGLRWLTSHTKATL